MALSTPPVILLVLTLFFKAGTCSNANFVHGNRS